MTFNVTFPVETQTPYRRKFLSIRHGGPRSRQRASGVIHGVIIIIECEGSQRWLITVTVQLTSTRLVVRESVDDAHGIAFSLCDSYA